MNKLQANDNIQENKPLSSFNLNIQHNELSQNNQVQPKKLSENFNYINKQVNAEINLFNEEDINSKANADTEIEPFKVYLRIRPFNTAELIKESTPNNKDRKKNEKQMKSIIQPEGNMVYLYDPTFIERKEKPYHFDRVYDMDYGNLEVFTTGIKPIIENLLLGYNSTTLAYGVTGTGKTHTIFGSFLDPGSNEKDLENREKGICIYAVDYLFQKINETTNKEFGLKISYLEIYNEMVIDLLSGVSQSSCNNNINSNKIANNVPITSNNSQGPPKSLFIVEDSVKGVVVPDLREFQVTCSSDLIKLINEGNKKRTMAPTNLNQFSSRSHAILQIMLEQKEKVKDICRETTRSKLLIVDLAGSEKLNESKGKRIMESSNINKSLLSLGNCINILSDKTKKGSFVPYRDSKLTRLLKDSLGGNIQTVMIACIGPSKFSYDETLSTINYATRARKIQKKVTKNAKEVDIHIGQYMDIIDSLKLEVEQLKEIIREQTTKMKMSNEVFENITKNIASNIEDEKRKEFENTMRNKEYFCKKCMKHLRINSKGKLEESADLGNMSGNNKELNKLSKENDIVNVEIQKDIIEENKNNAQDSELALNEASDKPECNLANSHISIKNSSMINPPNLKELTLPNQEVKELLQNNESNLHLKENDRLKKPTTNTININALEENNDKINIEDLEKQIEALNNDKDMLENQIENGEINVKNNLSLDTQLGVMKQTYEKYLALINDKLIENIEQNTILKFNLKEIIDLNQTNEEHIKILEDKRIELKSTYLMNKSIEEKDKVHELLDKNEEEIKNTLNAIEENENLKLDIVNSLNTNLKHKKMLRKILLKLISKSVFKSEAFEKNLQIFGNSTFRDSKRDIEVSTPNKSDFETSQKYSKQFKKQDKLLYSNYLEGKKDNTNFKKINHASLEKKSKNKSNTKNYISREDLVLLKDDKKHSIKQIINSVEIKDIDYFHNKDNTSEKNSFNQKKIKEDNENEYFDRKFREKRANKYSQFINTNQAKSQSNSLDKENTSQTNQQDTKSNILFKSNYSHNNQFNAAELEANKIEVQSLKNLISEVNSNVSINLDKIFRDKEKLISQHMKKIRKNSNKPNSKVSLENIAETPENEDKNRRRTVSRPKLSIKQYSMKSTSKNESSSQIKNLNSGSYVKVNKKEHKGMQIPLKDQFYNKKIVLVNKEKRESKYSDYKKIEKQHYSNKSQKINANMIPKKYQNIIKITQKKLSQPNFNLNKKSTNNLEENSNQNLSQYAHSISISKVSFNEEKSFDSTQEIVNKIEFLNPNPSSKNQKKKSIENSEKPKKIVDNQNNSQNNELLKSSQPQKKKMNFTSEFQEKDGTKKQTYKGRNSLDFIDAEGQGKMMKTDSNLDNVAKLNIQNYKPNFENQMSSFNEAPKVNSYFNLNSQIENTGGKNEKDSSNKVNQTQNQKKSIKAAKYLKIDKYSTFINAQLTPNINSMNGNGNKEDFKNDNLSTENNDEKQFWQDFCGIAKEGNDKFQITHNILKSSACSIMPVNSIKNNLENNDLLEKLMNQDKKDKTNKN